MNENNSKLIQKLMAGNARYVESSHGMENISPILRLKTAEEGQNPDAIVIACSDSRVMPNSIFSADLGELFVIRVAGNVLDMHQLGSIEYAVAHLGVNLIIMLGHTGCGAVKAALCGNTEGYIRYITDDIRLAAGDETDYDKATIKNILHGTDIIKNAFKEHPEIDSRELDVIGALYDIKTGEVKLLPENK